MCVRYRSNKPSAQEKRKPEALSCDIDYLLGICEEGAVWPTVMLLIWLKTRQALELPFISQEPRVHLPRLCGASDTASTWQQRPSCPKSEKEGCRCVFPVEDSSEGTWNALAEGQDFWLPLKIRRLHGTVQNKSTLPHKQARSLPICFFHPAGFIKGSQDQILQSRTADVARNFVR